MSQIQRVMAELGIESIPAYSPQAKGRIERLWGTLQDRLTKELRLAGITTLEAANAFLPASSSATTPASPRPPQDPHSAWVPLPADLDLNYYFAIRETRKVRADHCISFAGQLLQLLPGPKDPSLVDQRITVHVVPEGDIYLYHGKRRIAYQPVAAAPPAAPAAPTPRLSPPHRPTRAKAGPGNGPGSLVSPNRRRCTMRQPCARLSAPARRIGATLGSDPERRRRASVGEAGGELRSHALPLQRELAFSQPTLAPCAKPMRWLPANALAPTPPPLPGL